MIQSWLYFSRKIYINIFLSLLFKIWLVNFRDKWGGRYFFDIFEVGNPTKRTNKPSKQNQVNK